MSSYPALEMAQKMVSEHLDGYYERQLKRAINQLRAVLEGSGETWPLAKKEEFLQDDSKERLTQALMKAFDRPAPEVKLVSLEEDLWQPLRSPILNVEGFKDFSLWNDDESSVIIDSWLDYRSATFDVPGQECRESKSFFGDFVRIEGEAGGLDELIEGYIINRFSSHGQVYLYSPHGIMFSFDLAAAAAVQDKRKDFDAWMEVLWLQFKVSLLGFRRNSQSSNYYVVVA